MFVSISHGSNTINVNEVGRAAVLFSERFGAAAVVRTLSIKGRVLEVEFSRNICQTCYADDYFDGLALVLEEVSGAPYAVWDVLKISGNVPCFIVKIVKLDFLDEIRSAICKVEGIVKNRMIEFERIGGDENSLFEEMCFCILTANFTAEGGIKIQQNLEDGFKSLTKDELVKALRVFGYRFPNTRANYIVENREYSGSLLEKLGSFKDGKTAREWLIRNVKGLGYKEASHFLRNSGFKDVAIIDRHILKYLSSRNLIELPRTLTKRRYLEYERLLYAIARKLEISLAELDLFLWYIMTGKVLK
jgi:N-glycosylase/DNA lyase